MNNSSKDNTSRKEEILAKSRQSKKDEGMEHAEIKGLKLGEWLGSAVAIILGALAFFIGQDESIFAIGTLVFAMVFGQSLAVYRFKKTKYYFAWLILGIIGTIWFFVLFIAATQEWDKLLGLLWWSR